MEGVLPTDPLFLLIGPMGSGKSTVGRLLAARLVLPCVDLDEAIVEASGKSIPVLFSEEGEAAFRDREAAMLQKLCGDGQGKVIATGGGVVLRAENRALLQNIGYVIWLDAPPEVLASRTRGDANRPLLHNVDPLMKAKALDSERRPYYAACADFHVQTSCMGVQQTVDTIVAFAQTQE